MFESRYYIEYTQDAGMFMECCVVVEAESLDDLNASWVARVREKGFACHPCAPDGAEVAYNKVTLVPYHMNSWTDDQIIKELNV